MIQEKAVTVGETDYRIQQLPASAGLKLFFKISKMLKSIAKGADLIGSKKILDLDIGEMLEGLLGSIDEDKTQKLIEKLVDDSVVSPKDIIFDIQFAGNYDELSELIFEILKLNYEKAFRKLKKKASPILKNRTRQDTTQLTT